MAGVADSAVVGRGVGDGVGVGTGVRDGSVGVERLCDRYAALVEAMVGVFVGDAWLSTTMPALTARTDRTTTPTAAAMIQPTLLLRPWLEPPGCDEAAIAELLLPLGRRARTVCAESVKVAGRRAMMV